MICLGFTAASLEAHTAPSCQFLNPSPKRLGWGLDIQAGTAQAMPVRHQVCPLRVGATHEPGTECTDLRSSSMPVGPCTGEAATPASPAAVSSSRGDA